MQARTISGIVLRHWVTAMVESRYWKQYPTELLWTMYRATNRDYRWRVQTANGVIVGAASQGYERKAQCVQNMRLFGYRNEYDDTARAAG